MDIKEKIEDDSGQEVPCIGFAEDEVQSAVKEICRG